MALINLQDALAIDRTCHPSAQVASPRALGCSIHQPVNEHQNKKKGRCTFHKSAPEVVGNTEPPLMEQKFFFDTK